MNEEMSERIDQLQARQEGQSGEPGGETMVVPVNVYEAGEALVVVAPLPGVQAEDVALRS